MSDQRRRGTEYDRGASYLLEEPDRLARESKRLQLQAQHLFELESRVLAFHGVKSASKLIELGCGNGYFLKELSNFTNAQIYGVDRLPALLKQATEVVPEAALECLELGTGPQLSELLQRIAPDYLIARYVLQHMTPQEQDHMLSAVRKHKSTKARLLVIDTDDALARFDPPAPAIVELFSRKAEKQAQQGGNRNIGSMLQTLLESHGFTDIRQTTVDYTNEKLGWATWRAVFWPVIRAAIPAAPTQADQALIEDALHWFTQAEKSQRYSASIFTFQTSGI